MTTTGGAHNLEESIKFAKQDQTGAFRGLKGMAIGGICGGLLIVFIALGNLGTAKTVAPVLWGYVGCGLVGLGLIATMFALHASAIARTLEVRDLEARAVAERASASEPSQS